MSQPHKSPYKIRNLENQNELIDYTGFVSIYFTIFTPFVASNNSVSLCHSEHFSAALHTAFQEIRSICPCAAWLEVSVLIGTELQAGIRSN